MASSCYAPTTPRIGRLAPSPTGALHLGNIRTFLYAWLQMRSCGGTLRLRIEDLDHPKHKPGADQALIDDLRWLGFDWDGPIVYQSQRHARYRAALARLAPSLYPCTCTRADILGAQSAPHPGEVLRYPGLCRARLGQTAPLARPPAWRLALTSADDGRFTDGFAGPFAQTADETTGDFVVARALAPTPPFTPLEAEASYALAVVVDDAEMGVTDIVRGDDILPATPAQVVLYRRLGLKLPRFWHLPLVVGPDGLRLAKRHGDTRIATYRAHGLTPGALLTALARASHWLSPTERVSSLPELLPHFNPNALPKTPLVWDEAADAGLC